MEGWKSGRGVIGCQWEHRKVSSGVSESAHFVMVCTKKGRFGDEMHEVISRLHRRLVKSLRRRERERGVIGIYLHRRISLQCTCILELRLRKGQE